MNGTEKYPLAGTAEWWSLRKQIEESIATESRKRGIRYTEAQFRRSENARLCSLGDEDACKAYERNGFTREQWLSKWNPEGKTNGRIDTDF